MIRVFELNLMKNIFLFSFIFLVTEATFSQAWIKPKGSGYSQVGYSSISSSKIYGVDNTDEQLVRVVTDQTVQGYLEYGLGNKLMITTSIPFKMLETGNDVFATNYVSDSLVAGGLNALGCVSLMGLYGISQNTNWKSSVGLGFDTKTATFDSEIGLRTGVDAWSGLMSFNLGRGWNKFFFQATGAMKFRSNNYSSQVIASTQFGRTIKKVQIIFGLELYKSLKNGSYDDGTSVHTGLYQNDLEFLSFSLKANYLVNDYIKIWGFVGGGLLGQLVARAPAYALSVSYEWNKGA